MSLNSNTLGLTFRSPSTWEQEKKRFFPMIVSSTMGFVQGMIPNAFASTKAMSMAVAVGVSAGVTFISNVLFKANTPADLFEATFGLNRTDYVNHMTNFFNAPGVIANIKNSQVFLELTFDPDNVMPVLEAGFDFHLEDDKGIQWQS